MKYKKTADIVREKPYLFWYIKDTESLSDEAIVEAILNRGDFDDFLQLIDIMSMKKIAKIFHEQISMKRTNYSKKTENYFRLFFERHIEHV